MSNVGQLTLCSDHNDRRGTVNVEGKNIHHQLVDIPVNSWTISLHSPKWHDGIKWTASASAKTSLLGNSVNIQGSMVNFCKDCISGCTKQPHIKGYPPWMYYDGCDHLHILQYTSGASAAYSFPSWWEWPREGGIEKPGGTTSSPPHPVRHTSFPHLLLTLSAYSHPLFWPPANPNSTPTLQV